MVSTTRSKDLPQLTVRGIICAAASMRDAHIGLVQVKRLLRLRAQIRGVQHILQMIDLEKMGCWSGSRCLAPSLHQHPMIWSPVPCQALDLEDNALADWSEVARLAPLTALTRLQLGGNRLASVARTPAPPGAPVADHWAHAVRCSTQRWLHTACGGSGWAAGAVLAHVLV